MIKKAKQWIENLDNVGATIVGLRARLEETLEIHVESTDTEDKEAAEMIGLCNTVLASTDKLNDILRMQLSRKTEAKKQKKGKVRTVDEVFDDNPAALKKHLQDIYDALHAVPGTDNIFAVIKELR